MNYRKLLLASILGGSLLTGCATLDGFLADLGLKNTDKVEQVAITPINENYVFVKTANVRIAPNDQTMIIGTLKAGQRFFALGRTENNWIAISDTSGKRLGYVHGSLVQNAKTYKAPSTTRKVRTTKPATSKATETVADKTVEKSTSSGVNLDDLPAKSSGTTTQPKSQGVNLDDL